jgi:hypothetical protein
MQSWTDSLWVVALASGAAIAWTGCGSSTDDSRKDAAQGADVPISSGGATGIGDGAGTGGITGAGGTGPAPSGGAVTGGIATTALGGGPGLGGALSTGGHSATGNGGSAGGSGGSLDGGSGVSLTVVYDSRVHATWRNQTGQSIFLNGCGTVEWSRLEGGAWVNRGGFMVCTSEGVAVEVAAGATYTDNESLPQTDAGRYRLTGRYGVGCTPGLELSNAGCTSVFTATSNEFTLSGLGGRGGGGNSMAAGGAVGGTGGRGGATSAGGAGGTMAMDAGVDSVQGPVTYSGCGYGGDVERAVVARFDAQAGTCVTLVLESPHRAPDASLGMTISDNWGVAALVQWPSSINDCATRNPPASALGVSSASGSVTVNRSSGTIDIDAEFEFPVTDWGAAQSVEMKAQGVDYMHNC